MATTQTHNGSKGLSRELRASTAFLLKRLGFAVKERWHDAFEPTGLQPQHHAVMSLLELKGRVQSAGPKTFIRG